MANNEKSSKPMALIAARLVDHKNSTLAAVELARAVLTQQADKQKLEK